MANEAKKLSEEERASKRSPAVRSLHKLFDAMKLARFARAPGLVLKRMSKMRPQRDAAKKAWALAQSERHIEVACCHKCRAWFPSFEKRNAHKTACPKSKAA